MKRVAVARVAGAITIGAALATSGSIANAEDGVDINQVAELVGEAAPGADSLLVPTETSGADWTFSVQGGTEVTVPTEPGDAVTIGAADGGLSLEVSLPAEIALEDADVASDGSVVFADAGAGVHAVVQVIDDASVRFATVLESDDAPSEYSYDLGELTPVLAPDGSVDLYREVPAVGAAVLVGTVEAPWAVDAGGLPVATSYSVDGHSLVQHVAHDSSSAYPITADPKLTKTWWNTTIYFNRSETKRIGDRAPLASILAFLPSTIAKAVGAYLVTSSGLFDYYYSNGQCGKMVSYGSGLGVYFPQQYGGSEAGGYCK